MPALHRDAVHESAWRHVSGEARYVDDLPAPPGMLVGVPATSPHAHARLVRRDATRARSVPGVRAVLFASDVPGSNHVGPIVHDETLLAEEEAHYVGHPWALVVGETYEACRAGVAALEAEWEPLPAITSLKDAIAKGSFLNEPHRIARGDVDGALASAVHRVSGEVENGAQDHFYLETHAALVVPEEGGSYKVYSSTQHPTEVQAEVASVLGLGRHRVTCECPRMGGGFGGKESQASTFGCLAAIGARATGRPVKVWLDRDQDMTITGKRHPFWTRYEAGFDADLRLVALRTETYADGGWSTDLTPAIVDRCLFHTDNAYFLPACDLVARGCRTNLPSNTAFRGFGGPQGMLIVEDALNRLSERTGVDGAEIRSRNFYREGRDVAPYGQRISDIRLDRIWRDLRQSSGYDARRAAIAEWNAAHRHHKRGIAFQPIKFGISFTNSLLNQAGALVLVYADGTVQLNHGGTEMGQGLHTKMLAVCADTLGIPVEQVRAMPTSTEKVPNTSATAASSGTDLNGAAVREACETIRERMRPVAERMPGASFAEVAKQCWAERISLSATGYYRTPGIHYDRAAGRGTPFYYFAYGGAVVEVELSGLTGEHRVLRADILHDVGDALVPSIDKGQVEGGFVQGLGWLTCEEVLYDASGRLLTHGPSTYKIPAVGDVPADLRVELLKDAPQPGVIGGSKAVGEPPLMLAIGAVSALRAAVSAFAAPGHEVDLRLPATPEALLRAVEDLRARAAQAVRGAAK